MAQAYGGAAGARPTTRSEPNRWAVGWSAFAAIMMVVQGVWWVVSGIGGIAGDEVWDDVPAWFLRFDITAWGWIHLVVGIVLFLAGLAVFGGAVWGRAVGVGVASLAMLAAFAWLPYYPVFATLFIAISVTVIWALTVHGRELAEASRTPSPRRGE